MFNPPPGACPLNKQVCGSSRTCANTYLSLSIALALLGSATLASRAAQASGANVSLSNGIIASQFEMPKNEIYKIKVKAVMMDGEVTAGSLD